MGWRVGQGLGNLAILRGGAATYDSGYIPFPIQIHSVSLSGRLWEPPPNSARIGPRASPGVPSFPGQAKRARKLAKDLAGP